MSAIFLEASAAPATLVATVDADMPGFCPLQTSTSTPTADDARLSFLFRGTLKLGRIHPLYLPMQKYRHARTDRG